MEFLQYNSLDASSQLTAVAMQITDKAVKRSTNAMLINTCAVRSRRSSSACSSMASAMRYDTNCAPDGLEPEKAVFFACSFWLADVCIPAAAAGRQFSAGILPRRLDQRRRQLD